MSTTWTMAFDAVDEPRPGAAWRRRWDETWPAYRAWFLARAGDRGPGRAEAEAALAQHMPELAPIHARLTELAGGDDLAARFLATWCPPLYLGQCSILARSAGGETRLVRNYDLAPELNEGLFLRSEWGGRAVMGMVEFLWGLSDGVNEEGLSVALAHGGSSAVGPGFGIATIVRYVLQTCTRVGEATAALARLPSHMDYNLVLADATGATASVEMRAGGGMALSPLPLATNHQKGAVLAERAGFTKTLERRAFLKELIEDDVPPARLAEAFGRPPLFQRDYGRGFGTLFTAAYDPARGAVRLIWEDETWDLSLDDFAERHRVATFGAAPEAKAADTDAAGTEPDAIAALADVIPEGRRTAFRDWLARLRSGQADWATFGTLFVPERRGRQAGSDQPTVEDTDGEGAGR